MQIKLVRIDIHNAEELWKMQVKAFQKLYEKLGYKHTGKTQKVNDKLTLVFYRKE